ncbi:MAG: hypothetical protein R3E82_11605 [Pseudomonadales bacterium]
MKNEHQIKEPRFITVRYEVFLAAEGLKAESAALGVPEFNIAEREREAALTAGNRTTAAFWCEVWQYWMQRECLPKGTVVVIGTLSKG